jgi:SAM-dependent methyltransferase
MLSQLLYRLMYWFGQAHWDTGETPPEVRETFEADGLLPGPALDLGCGSGTNVIFMAQHGREAIGVDFVPSVVAQAREKARQAGLDGRARFLAGDVTRLAELGLPPCAFALDMGCVHGLDAAGQRRYAEGLAATIIPGGRFLLYTLDPRKEAGLAFGLAPEQVRALFAPWFEVEREARGGPWDNGSTWFWLKRKAG